MFLASLPIFALLLSLESKLKGFQRLGKDKFILLFNIQWALFLSFFIFILGSQRWIFEKFNPFGQTAFTIISFTIYLIMAYLADLWIENTWRGRSWAKKEAISSVRFLIPFILPFILLIIFTDLASLLFLNGYIPSTPPYDTLLYSLMIPIAIVALFFIHPHIAIKVWDSPPLHNSALLENLESLCKKAGFTHSGIREWTVKNRSLTAAIIGIAGCSRYVLFSPKLLEISSQDALCAILGHEIGHWRHRHLLLYPFILFEMTALSLLTTTLLLQILEATFGFVSAAEASSAATTLLQGASFLILAVCMGIYFRLVFGYFSRLFERQADIYPVSIGIPLKHMIEALDTLGTAGGNIHDTPSWHHFSIRQRINFLKEVESNPLLIEKHNRKVTYSLIVFFIIFAATVYALFVY